MKMIKQIANLSHPMECKCHECQIIDKISEIIEALNSLNETGGECDDGMKNSEQCLLLCPKCKASIGDSIEYYKKGCWMCNSKQPKPTKECTCNINLHNSLKDVLEAEKTCEVHKQIHKPQEGWEEGILYAGRWHEIDCEFPFEIQGVCSCPKIYFDSIFIERKKVEEAIEEEIEQWEELRQLNDGRYERGGLIAVSDLKKRLL